MVGICSADIPLAMAPHAVKRRKLAHSSSSDGEDGDDASDNGLASPKNGGVAVDEEKRNMGRRLSTSGNTRKYQDEMSQFASNACNSNTFKLQMDELLIKVRPKYGKRMVKVENALHKLKDIIENIPCREALSVRYGSYLSREPL